MDEEECGLAAVIEEEEPQSADEVGATQVKACSSIRYSTTVHSFSEHFPKYRPENTSANFSIPKYQHSQQDECGGRCCHGGSSQTAEHF